SINFQKFDNSKFVYVNYHKNDGIMGYHIKGKINSIVANFNFSGNLNFREDTTPLGAYRMELQDSKYKCSQLSNEY
ncbi:MAG: hypothetical protein OEV66_12640, partial [Spirochaetia bacterium]|nr:hypothetical protein [Spirochaetia bacterium]